MKLNHILFFSALFFSAASCTVGPKFRPPVVETPERYIGTANDTTKSLEWWEIFEDTTLVRLVNTAVEKNKNVQMAYSRIEQARIALKATRASLGPSLQYGVTAQYGKETHVGLKSDQAIQTYIIKPTLTWELDLFGKIRNQSKSDQNQLLATGMAAQGVLVSLVSEVATTYFSYLQYEYALSIAESTLASRENSYRLMKEQFKIGTITETDLRQAQSSLASAAASIPQYKQAKTETLYSLCLLMGQNPSDCVGRHAPLIDQPIPAGIPAGIPSDLLSRRPDLMEAYYQVASANAQIGVAQAMRFPTIALTGTGGVLSESIKDLFKSGSFIWSAAGAVSGPIFQFGANKRRVELAREKNREAVLNYEQTFLQAVNDVENALNAVSSYRDQLQAQATLLDVARKTYDLSQASYKVGQISYLNVLDAERTLFDAQVGYTQTLNEYMGSYVTLYKALGGGWVTDY